MDKILWYILVGLGLFFGLKIFVKAFGFYWAKGYEKRQQKREKRKLEKLKWKYANVNKNNPLLERIAQNRFVIFKGDLGKGKSILMNVTAHYLWQKFEEQNHKQRRYNKVMRSDYVAECNNLKDNNMLPIYSNLDFVYKDKKEELKSQELLPYLTLHKRAIQGGIFTIDEFSSLFPKEMYQEQQAMKNPIVDEMKEFFKKERHYINGYILGTEQDGEDMYIGFRKNGYALVTALGTTASISKKGKFLRWLKNVGNMLLPAFFTTNWLRLFKQELFVSSKLALCCKLLVPSYFFLPVEYYNRKQAIHNKIKAKYMRYQTLLEFDGAQYYIRYTNADKFDYDTRAYKGEYIAKFDANGNRITTYDNIETEGENE